MDFIKKFLALEAAAGVLIFASAILSLSLINLFSIDLNLVLPGNFKFIVNDGLMSIFFFIVAVEIKREFLIGELSDWKRGLLPIIGAAGGMLVPALICMFFTFGTSFSIGWAIPTATDIAFVVGALALFGNLVPRELKIFLLALAIVDDLGAILIISIFYTHGTNLIPLLGIIGTLIFAKFLGKRVGEWLLLGSWPLVWFLLHESGIHASISGVILGAILSLGYSEIWVDRFHSWSSYLILPLFAFINSNVLVKLGSLEPTLFAGIFWGLILGKPLGISLFVLLAIYLGIASLPNNVNRNKIIAASCFAGIGFTMSIFIADLAFPVGAASDTAKIAILVGSLSAYLLGCFLFYLTQHKGR